MALLFTKGILPKHLWRLIFVFFYCILLFENKALFCHCLELPNLNALSGHLNKNEQNGSSRQEYHDPTVWELVSNAINSIFTGKFKYFHGNHTVYRKPIDNSKSKSVDNKENTDSLFLYPFAQATGDQCDLPQVIGTGPYRIPRWYYNPNTQKCNLFYYSGCCGNGNNFQSLQSCQVLCEADPCIQPKDSGIGSLQVPRYYYNKETKLCEQFLYFGSGGNRNNFATISDCRTKCPESPNPCAFGEPANIDGNGILQCGTTTVVTNTCPVNYYCHVGSSVTTTICCPKPPGQLDRCTQPKKPGIGNELLPRWYFDISTEMCTTLNYHGLQGNENNFLSKTDCETSCYLNPCATGTPFKHQQGTVLQCSADKSDSCPKDYFCHIGVDTKTTVCCPAQGDPCQKPPLVGNGNNHVNRWIYNKNTNKCDLFKYSGMGGNENNFMTEEQCKSACRTFLNVCPHGEPALLPNGSPFHCAEQDECPDNYWCHFGSAAERTMCCPNAFLNACVLPLVVGNGLESLQRWYFDNGQKKCLKFNYRGQMGNQNNFQTLQECQKICPEFTNPCPAGLVYQPDGEGTVPTFCSSMDERCPMNSWCHIGPNKDTTLCCIGNENPCHLQLSAGIGDKQLPRWFFNNQTNTCQQFTYSGLKGNQNNFLSKEACESKCRVFVNPCSTGQPKLDESGAPLKCSATGASKSCGMGFYCHVGATEQTTCCCQSVGNPCELSMSIGIGTHNLQRFYYNSMTRQCLPFVYRGLKGNENNFLSEIHCSAQCPIFVNPCLDNQRNAQPQSCTNKMSCPDNHWCHYGLTEETTVCCQHSGGNKCDLPLAIGEGPASVTRWYFRSSTRECILFYYKGLFGNANNFVSKEDCEKQCPTYVNACATGQPYLINNKPQTCGPSSPCQADYWCHIGGSVDTTMCCPGAKNPCDIPYTAGAGSLNLKRWYYDFTSKSCFEFQYRGMLGNTNNFLSKSDCDRTCQIWNNPCPTGTPLLGSDNKPQLCNPKAMLGVCPSHYWCHIGDSADSTACCPGEYDPCHQPLSIGVGSNSLNRWYFDINDFECKTFSYRGSKGNQNNFLSKDTCEKECPVFVNPCTDTQSKGQLRSCNPLDMSSCGANFWCHVGHSEETTVCCQGNASPCSVMVSEGVGSASLQRWYFDSMDKKCKQFVYKGSKGNQNNFLTQQQCVEACPVYVSPCQQQQAAVNKRFTPCNPSQEKSCSATEYCHAGPTEDTTVCCPGGDNRCSQPVNYGMGDFSLPRWYFDQKEKTCKSFSYKGLKGNQNNFLTYESCINECPVSVNPCPNMPANSEPALCHPETFTCPNGQWCHIGVDEETTACCPNAQDPCGQPKSPGSGKYSVPRFYYDVSAKQCLPFTYTGFRGNQNNFLTLELCEKQCKKISNPCQKGEPLITTGNVNRCNEFMPCPKHYFCHIGSSLETTTCCETLNEDPCIINMELGVGNDSLVRWYYNVLTKQCTQFTYRGMKGNQNNFLSQQDCEKSCRVFINPCAQGEPATSLDRQLIKCDAQEVCPDGFWCHYGDGEETSVCCPYALDSPCEQPMHVGSGNVISTRFYYNAISRTCQEFSYRGIKGNQNNFRTIQECQATCRTTPNPCRNGSPMKDPSGKWQQCSVSLGLDVCGPGYWCHVGADPDTTVCCPGSINSQEICPLTLAIGSGNSSLTRWAFDAVTRQCIQFHYQGLLGNQNNFLTKTLCEKTCPVFINPCSEGEPVKSSSGSPLYCSATNPTICPKSSWCHVGADKEATVCCPGAVENPCTLKVVSGSGPHNLSRWCFDGKKCTNFNYSGTGGNQNNFLNRNECSKTCVEFRNPCPNGEPAPGLGGNLLTCTFHPGCGSGYWCHLGASTETTVCCLGALETACNGLEPNQGVGELSLSRWFYDATSRQCNMFIYKGLKGNPNNFLTRDHCESTCKVLQNPCSTSITNPKYCSPMSPSCNADEWCHFGDGPETSVCCPGAITDVCSLPMMIGTGNNSLPRFYFNSASSQCLMMTYKGLGGNQNNFLTKATCESVCLKYPNPCSTGTPLIGSNNEQQNCNGLATSSSCPSGYWCHVGVSLNTTVCCPGTSDPCRLPMSSGVGDGALSRWYFDSEKKDCKQFTYNGLRGNQNNFVSEEACHIVCREFVNPCIGQPATTPTGHVVFCSVANKDNCPVNFWCHVGARPETTLCCPGATNPCSVPLAPGTGSENLTRWYYNADSRQCVNFVYNGIGGNQNNFISKAECERTCPAQLCALSVDPGTCNYSFTRYAYDRQKRNCVEFTYRGCGGNLNNFAEMDDCLSVCGKTGYRRRLL